MINTIQVVAKRLVIKAINLKKISTKKPALSGLFCGYNLTSLFKSDVHLIINYRYLDETSVLL